MRSETKPTTLTSCQMTSSASGLIRRNQPDERRRATVVRSLRKPARDAPTETAPIAGEPGFVVLISPPESISIKLIEIIKYADGETPGATVSHLLSCYLGGRLSQN